MTTEERTVLMRKIDDMFDEVSSIYSPYFKFADVYDLLEEPDICSILGLDEDMSGEEIEDVFVSSFPANECPFFFFHTGDEELMFTPSKSDDYFIFTVLENSSAPVSAEEISEEIPFWDPEEIEDIIKGISDDKRKVVVLDSSDCKRYSLEKIA